MFTYNGNPEGLARPFKDKNEFSAGEAATENKLKKTKRSKRK